MTYDEYFRACKRCCPVMLVISLFCAGLLFFATILFVPKQYEAESLFCIRNRDDYETGITSADLAASETLTDATIALMQGLHDGVGGLSFERLGAGVFRVTLTGTDKDALCTSLETLSAVSTETIPTLLRFSSLTPIEEIRLTSLPKKTLRNAVVGFAVGFAVSAVGVLFAAEARQKNIKHKMTNNR